MNKSAILNGSPVVFDRSCGFKAENFGLENEKIYRTTSVEIIPRETLLPAIYIEAGFIPDGYAKHLTKGIRTTNHDLMGSDRFFTVVGRKFSAMLFRLATASEVNQHARSIL